VDEAYTPEIGWAIGHGEDYQDEGQQDAVEADALYTLLEQEIVPLFYNRGADGIPHGWVTRMKSSMAAVCRQFNSNRMVGEYTERFYLPGMRRGAELAEGEYKRAKVLATWLRKVKGAWPQVQIVEVTDDAGADLSYAIASPCASRSPWPIGPRRPAGTTGVRSCECRRRPHRPTAHAHGVHRPLSDNAHLFLGTIECEGTGRWGYTVRLLPSHHDLVNAFDHRLPEVGLESQRPAARAHFLSPSLEGPNVPSLIGHIRPIPPSISSLLTPRLAPPALPT